MKSNFIFLTTLSLLIGSAGAQTLRHSIDSLATGFKGEVGLLAINLKNGDTVSYNADTKFPTASVIKIYVLAKLYQDIADGKSSMKDEVTLRDSDKVAGSGILLFMHDGLKVTLGDLASLMIDMSDNAAANFLTDKAGGVEEVSRYIQSLGLSNTRELAKIFDKHVYSDSAERKVYGIGVTTPRETADFLKMLYEGKIVNKKSSKEMVDLMKYQFYNTSIPRFLPTYKDTIGIAHKTGALDNTRNDCAIIFTPRADYVLSVFTTNNEDQRWITDNSAEVFIARASELIYDSFGR